MLEKQQKIMLLVQGGDLCPPVANCQNFILLHWSYFAQSTLAVVVEVMFFVISDSRLTVHPCIRNERPCIGTVLLRGTRERTKCFASIWRSNLH